MEKNEIKDRIQRAFDTLMNARNAALKELEEIVKAAGGFIPTLPCEEKPVLKATMSYNGDGLEEENIYAIRYVEGEGIYLCTRTMLDNYEYDNDYCFEYTYDFEEGTEDMANVQKMIGDLAYFFPIDDDDLVRSQTVISILGGLGCYLP